MQYFEILIPLVLIQSTVLGRDASPEGKDKEKIEYLRTFNTSVLTQKLYMYESY